MNKLRLNLRTSYKHFTPRTISRNISSEDMDKIKLYKENQEKVDNDRVRKTGNMLKNEFAMYRKGQFTVPKPKVPTYSDYVIVGGGIIGSSIAYALKNRAPESFEVTVIERDPKYIRSSSALSVGGIRQQFSLEENIQLSLYSAEFLRNVKQHLSVLDDDPPDIQFQPHGYLFLATEAGVDQMRENYKKQLELGARVKLFNPMQLRDKFPWLNLEGIMLGSYGVENEGWFDPWALLSAFKKKAVSLGTDYVNGEVIHFELEDRNSVLGEERGDPIPRSHFMYVKDDEGEIHCIEFSTLVIAAGAYSAEIARMLGIGCGPGLMSYPLPVEPRKRYVYVVQCEDGPGLNMPLTIDPSGTYVRREGLGGKYICGRSPSPEEEPDVSNLDVDYNYFENSIWPGLCKRIPAFNALKVSSAWAGYYDYNTVDQNVIFGSHPIMNNVYFATGFSGHGIQMAPAIGHAMMELLIDKEHETFQLQRFGFDRFIEEKPVYEQNIV